MSILKVSNITKIYPSGNGIRDISFTIDKPGAYALLGHNGAGKSTLLNIITGYTCCGTSILAPNGACRVVPLQVKKI